MGISRWGRVSSPRIMRQLIFIIGAGSVTPLACLNGASRQNLFATAYCGASLADISARSLRHLTRVFQPRYSCASTIFGRYGN